MGHYDAGRKEGPTRPFGRSNSKRGEGKAKDVTAKTVEFVPLLSVLKGQLEMTYI